MGNDGGSIPKRSEVVKQKKRAFKLEKVAVGSGVCSLTKEPLKQPLVACKRGLIYNKESLMKLMVDKAVPYAFRHIKRLSDLVNIKEYCFDK